MIILRYFFSTPCGHVGHEYKSHDHEFANSSCDHYKSLVDGAIDQADQRDPEKGSFSLGGQRLVKQKLPAFYTRKKRPSKQSGGKDIIQ
jgi:hypothetical protein